MFGKTFKMLSQNGYGVLRFSLLSPLDTYYACLLKRPTMSVFKRDLLYPTMSVFKETYYDLL